MKRVPLIAALSAALVVAACGSVSPLGVDGGAGAMGTAGTMGAAGTAGGAGTAGSGGHGGTSGRVPLKHRAGVACATDRPAGTCTSAPDAGFGCHSDSDCTAGSNGRCVAAPRLAVSCDCSYDTCMKDADCPQPGGVCECRPEASGQGSIAPTTPASPANACLAGNCRVDADCAGGYCSPSLGSCGNFGGVVGYYCHTPNDQCVDDSDCAARGGGDCRYNTTTGAWACNTSQCVG
jgi:hypothetical protein